MSEEPLTMTPLGNMTILEHLDGGFVLVEGPDGAARNLGHVPELPLAMDMVVRLQRTFIDG